MIIQKENKILRLIAKKIIDAKSAETRTLINRLAEAMFNEPDGIGIAAPQIGESFQVFLIAKDLLSLDSGTSEKKPKERKRDYYVFINPLVEKLSRKKENDIEGCLSVRRVYGEVLRAQKLTIEYFDETGKKHKRGASGLFARVIQHETDHLNGMLFIDRAKKLRTFNHAS